MKRNPAEKGMITVELDVKLCRLVSDLEWVLVKSQRVKAVLELNTGGRTHVSKPPQVTSPHTFINCEHCMCVHVLHRVPTISVVSTVETPLALHVARISGVNNLKRRPGIHILIRCAIKICSNFQ